MARVIFRANICFGRVTIPVGLAPAQKRKKIEFRTLHRDCGQPLSQGDAVCPEHGQVEPGDVAKGWELVKGQYVVVEQAEIDAITPVDSRRIEILGFVPAAEVDPIYLDRGYHLVPAAETISRRPYALFLEALSQSRMAALVRFAAWRREHVALVRALEGTLVLQTLFHAEDVRSSTETIEALAGTEISKEERKLAVELVANLAGPFDPAGFEPAERRVQAMLEQKLASGMPLVVVPVVEEAPPPPAANLAQALEQSLRDVKRPAKRRAKKRATAAAGA